MQFTITIPIVPSSQNRQLRMHWRERRRENAKLREMLWAHCCQTVYRRPEVARWWRARTPPPARVAIHMERPRRVQDADNRVACTKGLIDALRKVGAIRDDSPEWMTDLAVTESVGGPETTITMEYETGKETK